MSDKNKDKNKKNEAAEEAVKEETVLSDEQSEAAAAAPAEEAPDPAQEFDELLKAEKDRYMRVLAEYDNFRKRSQKERENIYADVKADTIVKFLPIYDNLARAVQHEGGDDPSKGIDMIFNQMKGVMESFGVVEIEAVGQKFDPTLHEALMHVEDEKFGENEIVMEFEKGFKFGDRVIRFSKVQVAN